MHKTIKLNATLRDIAGAKTIDVDLQDGQTVRELLQAVEKVSPPLAEAIVDASGNLTGRVHILVHGRNIEWLDGLDTPVTDRDQLVFMPPSAGG